VAMRRALVAVGGHIDAIFYCPHAPEERCSCRKPEPGLLVRAMYELRAAPEQTAYVGDSIRDMQAALTARCTPVLVRTGNGAASELQARALGIEQIFDDLAGAVDWLANR
jgi:D-glycero-D-manno-heptose 1,7-bisphosphate phosphatase